MYAENKGVFYIWNFLSQKYRFLKNDSIPLQIRKQQLKYLVLDVFQLYPLAFSIQNCIYEPKEIFS